MSTSNKPKQQNFLKKIIRKIPLGSKKKSVSVEPPDVEDFYHREEEILKEIEGKKKKLPMLDGDEHSSDSHVFHADASVFLPRTVHDYKTRANKGMYL